VETDKILELLPLI